ncbi:MAG: nucleotide-binding universal stress UspA family protein [Myxococcota bacterium]|jgi:nucleotide-binding universal stress UspA family protein
MFPADRVLVPVDFSDPSLSALRQAAALVSHSRGLHVVHVLPELSALTPSVTWGSLDDTARVRNVKKHLAGVLAELGISEATAHVVVHAGDPAPRIADLATKLGVQALVLSSRGRTADKLVIGSVAERVVRLARCPVLVVHP